MSPSSTVTQNSSSRRFLAANMELDTEPNPFEKSFCNYPRSTTHPPLKPTLPPISAMASPTGPINTSDFLWPQSSLRLGPLSPAMLVEPQNCPLPSPSTPAINGYNNRLPPIHVQSPLHQLPERPTQVNGQFFQGQDSATITHSPATGEEVCSVHSREPVPSVPATDSTSDLGTRLVRRSYPSTRNATRSSPRKREASSRRTERRMESPRRRSSTSEVTQSNANATKKNKRKGVSTSLTVEKRALEIPLAADEEVEQDIEETRPDRKLNNDSRKKKVSANGSKKRTYASRSASTSAESVERDGNHSTGSNGDAEEGIDREEDRRKSFLERNRQAALKCRQRKKQWLHSLQQTVEHLSSDNRNLQGQATTLREEIINLKTLLLAHKECPVAQANGVMGLDILNATALRVGGTQVNTSAKIPGVSRASQQISTLDPRTMLASQYGNGSAYYNSTATNSHFSRQQPPSVLDMRPHEPENISQFGANLNSVVSDSAYPRRVSFSFSSHHPTGPHNPSPIIPVAGRPPLPNMSAFISTLNGLSTGNVMGTCMGAENVSRASLEGQKRRNSDVVAETSSPQ